MHPENCQLNPILLRCSTDIMVYVECVFKFFTPPEAVDCTPQKCKTYFCSSKVY